MTDFDTEILTLYAERRDLIAMAGGNPYRGVGIDGALMDEIECVSELMWGLPATSREALRAKAEVAMDMAGERVVGGNDDPTQIGEFLAGILVSLCRDVIAAGERLT